MSDKVDIIKDIENYYIDQFPIDVNNSIEENRDSPDFNINEFQPNDMFSEYDYTYSRIGMLIELHCIDTDSDIITKANDLCEKEKLSSIKDPEKYVKTLIAIERKVVPDKELKKYLNEVDDDLFINKVNKATYSFQ